MPLAADLTPFCLSHRPLLFCLLPAARHTVCMLSFHTLTACASPSADTVDCESRVFYCSVIKRCSLATRRQSHVCADCLTVCCSFTCYQPPVTHCTYCLSILWPPAPYRSSHACPCAIALVSMSVIFVLMFLFTSKTHLPLRPHMCILFCVLLMRSTSTNVSDPL